VDAGWVCCGGAVCWDIFTRDPTDDEMTMVARAPTRAIASRTMTSTLVECLRLCGPGNACISSGSVPIRRTATAISLKSHRSGYNPSPYRRLSLSRTHVTRGKPLLASNAYAGPLGLLTTMPTMPMSNKIAPTPKAIEARVG